VAVLSAALTLAAAPGAGAAITIGSSLALDADPTITTASRAARRAPRRRPRFPAVS
jgi:hypothetical protein